MENQLIPQQETGSQMDAVASTSFATPAAASAFYVLAKNRLGDVNNWANICGTEATTFELLDASGTATAQLAEGHLIKIDIPGPGTSAGEGYDWVRIESILNHNDPAEPFFGFRVRPCPNPHQPEKGVAHFFKDTATSTFLVKLNGNVVTAEMHGRNEEPNTVTSEFFDDLRNMTVGYSAKIGLSYPQWKLLVQGIVKQTDE